MKPTDPNTNQSSWKEELSLKLSTCRSRIWVTDLDGTFWQDILVMLNNALGPDDPVTGEKKWLQYDRAYKIDHTMTNGEHLIAHYRDLLAIKTIDELIAWVEVNVQLIPGTIEFVKFLQSCDISIVAVSNGAKQLAQPKLNHHGLNIPLISNWFDADGKLCFLHDDHVGIDKGLVVQAILEAGFEVIGFSGDAKGDIEGARVAARNGGLVLAFGDDGLAQWCGKNLMPEQWLQYSDFKSVITSAELQQRVGGH